MKRITLELLKTFLAVLVAGFFLNCFSFLYKYTGAHIINESGATDYKWNESQYFGGMEEGFNWGHVNSEGFNNSFERPESIDVLFMGSSNTEGFNVPLKSIYPEVFRQLKPSLSTYSIGISGHYLDACIDNLEDAIKDYTPQKYIVIETFDICISEEESDAAINHERVRNKSTSGIISQGSKYLPFIKLLFLKISEWRMIDLETPNSEKQSLNDDYKLSLEKMMAYAGSVAKANNLKLIIVYHPDTILSGDGDLVYEKMEWAEKICDLNNIIFVDMAEDFFALYHEKHVLAHGFINSAVGTGHLNRYGHQVIAKRLAEIIEEGEEL